MALFSAIGAGIKLAGAGIKSIVNRAREKRAMKKAARAAQKQADAGALLSKIIVPSKEQQPVINAGLVSDRLEAAPVFERKKVGPLVWVVSAVGALLFLLLLFKSK